jgi:hypothetical protein
MKPAILPASGLSNYDPAYCMKTSKDDPIYQMTNYIVRLFSRIIFFV